MKGQGDGLNRHLAAVMFTDMAGYTAMTERLGDRAALGVVRAHNEIVRREVEAHGGFEVELRGDGFLVAFPSALSGVRFRIATFAPRRSRP